MRFWTCLLDLCDLMEEMCEIKENTYLAKQYNFSELEGKLCLFRNQNEGYMEHLLWCNRVCSVLGALGVGSIPGPAQWVKDLVLQQLWLSSRLWLGSDPWPGSSICYQAAKKKGGGA